MPKDKTGAQLLVDCLVQHNVRYVFGIPGAKIDAVFNALIDSPIKIVVCRHEQNAAFMAAIHGRLTGQPGVVLVTSGPGVSNLATGLLTATTEGDAVIAIGGNVPRDMKLKASHQSTDNLKLMEAVTKARMEAILAENIPEIVENAFRIACAPKAGAVFISLPQDVLMDKTKTIAFKPRNSYRLGAANDEVIKKIATAINAAKMPCLLLGVEASRPENTAAIRQLLQTHILPTAVTFQAAGVVSHQLLDCFMGRVGLFKNQPGDLMLDESDLIITIGFNTVEYDPELWNNNNKKNIIHIDYNPADIHQAYQPVFEAVGDIALTLNKLKPLLHLTKPFTPNIESLHQDLLATINNSLSKTGNLLHPLQFIQILRNTLDDKAIVISDIGTHYMWLARYFLSFEPHHLLFSNGQQTLGVALPWALAAKLIHPEKTVVSISGDGGFLFSAMELETAVREKLSFIHFVWCDGKYDMVYEQEMLKYNRDSGVRFGYVDIVKYAESFGAVGLRVNRPEEFITVLKQALATTGPVLVEIPIDYSDNGALFLSAHEKGLH